MALIHVPARRIQANFVPDFPVRINSKWAKRIPNALVQSLGASVNGSPVTTVGTVGKVPTAGGVMSSHASAATNIQRTPFVNPYATGSGVGFWLLVQFITTTNQDKVIAGFGSDTGSAGNTIFSAGVDVDGTFRSLHGGVNNNSAWQDSNVVVTDGKVHTALIYTATSSSGATAQYKGFLDGVKYVDTTEALALGDLNYTYLCAGGTRRTTDLSGFDGNVGLVAVILDDMPDSVAASITRNPGQIFKPLEQDLNVAISAASGAAVLAGDAASTASATGALSVSVPLAGASVSTASATGALSVSIPLTATATATANATGGLSLSIPLSGSAVAQALASAGITQGVPLSGAAAALASASGGLSINISLAGAAISQAAASAGLTVISSGLQGDATATASASGALTHDVPLSGAALSVSSASGNITQLVPLAGAAASASLATGGLSLSVTLSGAALAVALASASLISDSGLSGAGASNAAASGTLTLRVNLSAAALSTVSASAALSRTVVELIRHTLSCSMAKHASPTTGLTKH